MIRGPVEPPTQLAPDEPAAQLAADEVRSRATSGAALLGARGLLVMIVGAAANLVLASLLTPRDFGLVTIGTVVITLATYLAEGGLGAALVRRREPPARSELEAVLGIQLGALTAIALAVAGAGALVGRDGLVVAMMTAALPLATLRTPSVIVLERDMVYRPIAVADVAEALVYYAWAIAGVAAGLGVWALASAVVVRAVAGSATITVLGPVGALRPRLAWSVVRPFAGFGAKFQAAMALPVAREQALNLVVAGVAGVAALGVWNLAWRVIQIPVLFFSTVSRVGFPAMSRLLGAGQDPRPLLERGVQALAAITAVAVVGLVGLSVALPRLVGHAWSDVPAVILWSGVALTISAPLLTATVGYLYAAGAAGIVAVATLASGLVWCVGSGALLPRYGPPAVGIAWVAAAVVNTAIVARRAGALTGAALAARAAPGVAVSLVAIAAGWLVGHAPDGRLIGGVAGFVTAEAVLLGGLAIVSRRGLADAWALLRQGLESFRSRA